MSITLSPGAGELGLQSIPRLVDPLIPRAAPSSPTAGKQRVVVLDLREVRFVTPFALVTLGAIVEALAATGLDAQITFPTDPNCRHYLGVAGFASLIANAAKVVGADADVPPGAGWSSDTVLPVSRLEGTGQIPPLIRLVEGRLDQILGHRDQSWTATKRAIISTIRELCHNVFEHAQCGVCWIAGQRYRNSFSGRPYVEIGVADGGCGIRRSIGTRHRKLLHVSDAEAIQRTLVDGLSRLGTSHRGTGYYVLQKATRELDGSFHLRSGGGAAERPRRGPLRTRQAPARWPGTQLMIRVTCV